jgi:hypothetical protein
MVYLKLSQKCFGVAYLPAEIVFKHISLLNRTLLRSVLISLFCTNAGIHHHQRKPTVGFCLLSRIQLGIDSLEQDWLKGLNTVTLIVTNIAGGESMHPAFQFGGRIFAKNHLCDFAYLVGLNVHLLMLKSMDRKLIALQMRHCLESEFFFILFW